MQQRQLLQRLVLFLLCLGFLQGCSDGPPAGSGGNPFADGPSGTSAPAPVPATTRRQTPGGSSSADSAQPASADSRPYRDDADRIDQNMPRTPTRVARANTIPQPGTGGSNATTIPSIEPESPRVQAAWPQFRGPGGLGTSDESNLPETWSDGENLHWKAKLPGPGASSPIVAGDRAFVTYYTGTPTAKTEDDRLQRNLACFNLHTGEQLWESEPLPQSGGETPFGRYQARHGYASSTPCTDGRHIYCFFGTSGVAAYNFDGELVWHNRTAAGTGTDDWGSGSSPIIYEDLVILNACVESGTLVALNQDSGHVEWTAKNVQQSWATPVLVDVPGRDPELVLNAKNTIVALAPLTGDVLWYAPGVTDYVCPSVVSRQGTVFAIGGRRGMSLAVQAGGRGAIGRDRQIWQTPKGSNVPSPIVYDGHLYWVDDNGVAYCLSTLDGRVVKQFRLNLGEVYASLVAADGKFYVVSRERGACVLSAGPELHVLARNSFASDGSIFNASPAVADGRILLRSDAYLYCIGKR